MCREPRVISTKIGINGVRLAHHTDETNPIFSSLD